jgi:hypothetical protein
MPGSFDDSSQGFLGSLQGTGPAAGYVEWTEDARAVFEAQSFTMEVWVRPEARQDGLSMLAGNLAMGGGMLSGWGLLLQSSDGAWDEPGRGVSGLWAAFVVADARAVLAGGEPGPALQDFIRQSPRVQIPAGMWTHVAGAYDPALGARLFVNASLAAERPPFGGAVRAPRPAQGTASRRI